MRKTIYLVLLVIVSAVAISTASLLITTGSIVFENTRVKQYDNAACSINLTGFPLKVSATTIEPCRYALYTEPSPFDEGKASDKSGMVSMGNYFLNVLIWLVVLTGFASAVLFISFNPGKKTTKFTAVAK